MIKISTWEHSAENCFALSGQMILLTAQPRATLPWTFLYRPFRPPFAAPKTCAKTLHDIFHSQRVPPAALKAQYMTAQGNALGFVIPKQIQALKGRYKISPTHNVRPMARCIVGKIHGTHP